MLSKYIDYYNIEECNEGLEDVGNYTADFETTTDENDCRVWAWATCEIGNTENIQIGTSIESFITWCKLHSGSRVYFHNLKFDGKFIVSYILNDGWRWIPVKTECDDKTFTTLISDMNMWYSVKIWFDAISAVEFLDSLKIVPLPVAAIPKAFGLNHKKLEIEYDKKRDEGYILEDDEKEYITEDVVIVAEALEVMFDQGMTRITAGSNAFKDYVETIGGKLRFRDWFPEPDYDKDLREGGCYKGGFTAVNPTYAGIEVGEGICFDVNSLYPSTMASTHGEILPFGDPIYYEGEYIQDDDYPLYIQYLEADFKVKEDHIPSIQIKGNNRFRETEYVTDSYGMQTLCLVSVDLELFLEQYDILDIRYIRGYKFKGSCDLFIDFVNKWTEIKTKAHIDGNEGLRTISKLELNSLYGKTASNPIKQSRKPYLEDGIVKYKLLPEEYGEAIYLPVAAFITAYSRAFTLRAAQANYDRWLYSDTDSNYFIGTDPPNNMEISDTKLGAWKFEGKFDRFKAIRAKTYCYEVDGELTIHCAGMPTKCHKYVTMENFEKGASFEGKLRPKEVKGGIILEDTVFTIRE